MFRKKSMDIVDVYAWTRVYGDSVKGCRLNNVYYAGFYWLFKLNCPSSGRVFVKAEPGVRLHFSRVEPESKSIDRFSAFLRRRVRNALFMDAGMVDWERIIRFVLRRGGVDYRLYVELIPRGFIVITDPGDTILFANRFERLRDRVVRVHERYSVPPGSFSILEAGIEELMGRLGRGKDIVRGVVKGWGLPGYVAEELLYRSGLIHLKNEPPTAIGREEVEELRNTLTSLLREAEQGRGYIVSNSEPFIVSPFEPRVYMEAGDLEVKEFESFNEALDNYFTVYEKNRVINVKMEAVRSRVERLRKSLEEQRMITAGYLEKARRLEKILSAMYDHHGDLEAKLECARRYQKARGWEGIVEACGLKRAERDRGIIIVEVDGLDIPLDIRMDYWRNTVMVKRRIGELKAKAERAAEKAREMEERLREAERLSTATVRETRISIRPRAWFERYHWLITRNNFLAIGGRDAGQNEALVRRYLEQHDIYLHAEIHGGSSVVLKTRGKTPGMGDIDDAAVLAASYSRAWDAGLGSIDVFWVYGGQVSKTPPSGEYLGRGAFMVYGRKNFLRKELRLSIGVEGVCDPIYGYYQRVIVGSEDLVAGRAIVYGVLIPGGIAPRKVAEKLGLMFKSEIRGEIPLYVNIDEIAQRVPGPSRIVLVKRGSGLLPSDCSEEV